MPSKKVNSTKRTVNYNILELRAQWITFGEESNKQREVQMTVTYQKRSDYNSISSHH